MVSVCLPSDVLSQHLLSYWGFSYLGRGISPLGCSSTSPLFFIRQWNTKVGSQETPGVTGIFGLGIQNEAGQRLIEFSQENALVIANTLFQQHKRHHQMVNTEIRLIIFFAAKDGEALYSQQKQNQELTVA